MPIDITAPLNTQLDQAKTILWDIYCKAKQRQYEISYDEHINLMRTAGILYAIAAYCRENLLASYQSRWAWVWVGMESSEKAVLHTHDHYRYGYPEDLRPFHLEGSREELRVDETTGDVTKYGSFFRGDDLKEWVLKGYLRRFVQDTENLIKGARRHLAIYCSHLGPWTGTHCIEGILKTAAKHATPAFSEVVQFHSGSKTFFDYLSRVIELEWGSVFVPDPTCHTPSAYHAGKIDENTILLVPSFLTTILLFEPLQDDPRKHVARIKKEELHPFYWKAVAQAYIEANLSLDQALEKIGGAAELPKTMSLPSAIQFLSLYIGHIAKTQSLKQVQVIFNQCEKILEAYKPKLGLVLIVAAVIAIKNGFSSQAVEKEHKGERQREEKQPQQTATSNTLQLLQQSKLLAQITEKQDMSELLEALRWIAGLITVQEFEQLIKDQNILGIAAARQRRSDARLQIVSLGSITEQGTVLHFLDTQLEAKSDHLQKIICGTPEFQNAAKASPQAWSDLFVAVCQKQTLPEFGKFAGTEQTRKNLLYLAEQAEQKLVTQVSAPTLQTAPLYSSWGVKVPSGDLDEKDARPAPFAQAWDCILVKFGQVNKPQESRDFSYVGLTNMLAQPLSSSNPDRNVLMELLLRQKGKHATNILRDVCRRLAPEQISPLFTPLKQTSAILLETLAQYRSPHPKIQSWIQELCRHYLATCSNVNRFRDAVLAVVIVTDPDQGPTTLNHINNIKTLSKRVQREHKKDRWFWFDDSHLDIKLSQLILLLKPKTAELEKAVIVSDGGEQKTVAPSATQTVPLKHEELGVASFRHSMF